LRAGRHYRSEGPRVKKHGMPGNAPYPLYFLRAQVH
jgi:hypothetical protein